MEVLEYRSRSTWSWLERRKGMIISIVSPAIVEMLDIFSRKEVIRDFFFVTLRIAASGKQFFRKDVDGEHVLTEFPESFTKL